jgi:hypothetical protein
MGLRSIAIGEFRGTLKMSKEFDEKGEVPPKNAM